MSVVIVSGAAGLFGSEMVYGYIRCPEDFPAVEFDAMIRFVWKDAQQIAGWSVRWPRPIYCASKLCSDFILQAIKP